MTGRSHELSLVCHPAVAAPAIRHLGVAVRCLVAGQLELAYRLQGDFSGLRVPAPAAPRRADGLWKHSCFEAFVRSAGQAAYLEFNFSPSGEWAAYRFANYRQPAPGAEIPQPAMTVQRTADELVLEAVISLGDMRVAGGALQIGLSAVIEAADGGLSYWALAHPSDKPDFHHPESFALSLAMDDASQT